MNLRCCNFLMHKSIQCEQFVPFHEEFVHTIPASFSCRHKNLSGKGEHSLNIVVEFTGKDRGKRQKE